MNDSFREIRLGDFITDLPKSKLPAGAADVQGKYPFFCSSADVKATHTCLQNKHAVLMGTGGIATVHFGNKEYAYSTDTWGFRSDNDFLQTEYLYRIIQYNLYKIDYAGFEGSGLRHLRKDYVRDLGFDIPNDKNVRKRIIYFFNNLDDVIEKTEALIHKYQQIKAGLMHDLFTRGVTADGKLRPPREQAPELYKETPIGWIPKEWTTPRLKEICAHDITYGIVQAGPHIDGGVPYIRTGDMSGESLSVNGLLCTSRLIADSYKRSEVKAGEIVCAIRATVGKVLMVPEELNGANLTQGTARISPKEAIYAPFVLWGFRSYAVQKEFGLSIKGTTFNEITLRDLRYLKFPMPNDKNEQILIAKRLGACEERISQEVNTKNKLLLKKQGLMHDLLTGKVPVKINQEETAHV